MSLKRYGNDHPYGQWHCTTSRHNVSSSQSLHGQGHWPSCSSCGAWPQELNPQGWQCRIFEKGVRQLPWETAPAIVNLLVQKVKFHALHPQLWDSLTHFERFRLLRRSSPRWLLRNWGLSTAASSSNGANNGLFWKKTIKMALFWKNFPSLHHNTYKHGKILFLITRQWCLRLTRQPITSLLTWKVGRSSKLPQWYTPRTWKTQRIK